MPRDILHEKEFRAAPVPDPPVAEGTAGFWQAMQPWQRCATIGLPLLAAIGGAAYVYGPAPAQWPAAITVPSTPEQQPKTEPAQQPTVAAPPGAAAQRRANARPTPEQIPPAHVPLPGFSQAPAGRLAAPRLADQLPAPQALDETERVASTAFQNRPQEPDPQDWEETVKIAETAVPKPDPMVAVERLVQANKRSREAPPPAPAPSRSVTEVELAAMMTRLTAMVGDLAKTQMQDRDDFRAREEARTRQVEDLNARLALSEARTSFLSLAGGAPARAAEREAQPPVQTPNRRAAPPEVPSGSPVLGPQSYVVMSASPFLATVRHRNPMPDQPPPPELRVGSTVPGLGKVLGIVQEGTTWVVRTERGPITSGPVSATAR